MYYLYKMHLLSLQNLLPLQNTFIIFTKYICYLHKMHLYLRPKIISSLNSDENFNITTLKLTYTNYYSTIFIFACAFNLFTINCNRNNYT